MTIVSKSIDLDIGASLIYSTGFVNAVNADALMKHCNQVFPWEQSTISIFGKRVQIPRLNAWYGDQPYRYSGTFFEAREWTAELSSLKAEIEARSNLPFNSVLCNWYRDGKDCVGWHSDNEKMLGANPQIASISLGATRRFVLRNKEDKNRKVTLHLENGSLLLMLGDIQHRWQHCLPRTAGLTQSRINLTFRNCLPG